MGNIVSKIQFLFVGGKMDGLTQFVDGIRETEECLRRGERYVSITMLEPDAKGNPIGVYIMKHEDLSMIEVFQKLVRNYVPGAEASLPNDPFNGKLDKVAATVNGSQVSFVPAPEALECMGVDPATVTGPDESVVVPFPVPTRRNEP